MNGWLLAAFWAAFWIWFGVLLYTLALLIQQTRDLRRRK